MRRRVSKQGNVIEVTTLSGCNRGCHAIKVDAGHWVNPETGELHEYEHKGTRRTDNVQELRASFAKMRALINANCTEENSLRWVTLTYAENMQDLEKLYRDYSSYMKRLRRKYGRCEYIAVPEPQKRGSWHMHVILIYPERAPFIPNEVMRELWGHGFVRVNSLRGVDNVGAYLSAYLGDIEADAGQECDSVKVTQDGSKKRIVKGGRLHLYPAGMNVYRCSRGVKRPEVYWVENIEQEYELQRIDRELEPYVRVYAAQLDDGRTIKVEKRYYNVKRRRKQASGSAGDGTADRGVGHGTPQGGPRGPARGLVR